jgi:hypothetical protein
VHLRPLTPKGLGSSGLGHSERSEESRSDFSSAIYAAQSEIRRFARNDSFLPFTPHPSAFTLHPWTLLFSLCRKRFV